MKRVLTITGFVFSMLLFLPQKSVVRAVEGRIDMVNGNTTCFGISYYNNDRYRIVGRCQGLVYPYSEKLSKYYLWGNPVAGGPSVRLEEVDDGLFDAQTDTDIGTVFITAESDSTPTTPGTAVMSGSIAALHFASGSGTMSTPPIVTIVTTPSPTEAITGAPAISVRPFGFWPFGWVGSTIVGVLLLLLLGLVLFANRP